MRPGFPDQGTTAGQICFHPKGRGGGRLLNFPAVPENATRMHYFIKKMKPLSPGPAASRIFKLDPDSRRPELKF